MEIEGDNAKEEEESRWGLPPPPPPLLTPEPASASSLVVEAGESDNAGFESEDGGVAAAAVDGDPPDIGDEWHFVNPALIKSGEEVLDRSRLLLVSSNSSSAFSVPPILSSLFSSSPAVAS